MWSLDVRWCQIILINTSKVLVLHSHCRIYSGTYLSCGLKSHVCLSIYLLFLVNIDSFSIVQILLENLFTHTHPLPEKSWNVINVQHSQSLSRKCRIVISDLGLAPRGDTAPEHLILALLGLSPGYLPFHRYRHVVSRYFYKRLFSSLDGKMRSYQRIKHFSK